MIIEKSKRIGMYSGCDYLQKSCLFTVWACHPYFILQFCCNINIMRSGIASWLLVIYTYTQEYTLDTHDNSLVLYIKIVNYGIYRL